MRITLKILLKTVLIFTWSPVKVSAASQETVYKKRGDLYLLPMRSDQTVWVSNPAVARYRNIEGRHYLESKKTGYAQVNIGNSIRFTLRVLTRKQFEEFEMVKNAISKKRGLSADYMGQQLSVRGEILRARDFIDACTTLYLNQNQPVWHTSIIESQKEAFQNHLTHLLRPFGSPVFTWSDLPIKVFISNHTTKEMREQITNQLKGCGIPVVFAPISQIIPDTVSVRISVYATSKKVLEDVGFKGVYSFNPLLPSSIEENVLINQISQSGIGKSIYTTVLNGQYGAELNFQSGGEVAVRAGGYRNSKVTWKPYGLQFKITTLPGSSNSFSSDLNLKISSLDPSQAVDGIPGIKQQVYKNSINFNRGKSKVIAQFSRYDLGSQNEVFHAFKNVPILNKLFSSELESIDDLQVVFVMTIDELKSPSR
jgi:hypothetical protein